MIDTRYTVLLGLGALTLFAVWMLLAAPPTVIGLDSGSSGFALLLLAAWGSLYALSRLPLGNLDQAVSPGEWQAWIGTLFMALMTAYVLVMARELDAAASLHAAEVGVIGQDVVTMIIAWLIVSRVMAMRWKGQVQEDERDREIARVATNWGNGALTVCIIGIAVMLGLTPAAKLEWASPLIIAHLLIFALMWGGLVGYAATAIQHWRDRH